MLKIVGCFSIIMVFILSFGLIDVSAQTIDASAISSITAGRFNDGVSIFDIATVKIGSDTYALVGLLQHDDRSKDSGSSGGLEIFKISNPAMPTHIITINNGTGGFDEISPPKIATVEIGTNTYAVVAALNDDGVQIIDITNPATPIAVASIGDEDEDGASGIFDTLFSPRDITTFKIDTNTYAIVTASGDDGVQIIDITNPATPIAVASVTDGDRDGDNKIFDTLDGAWGITTVTMGDSTYALVVSYYDDGIQIINITNPAMPTAVTSVTDGVGEFDELENPEFITTVKIGSSVYALVSSGIKDTIQIIDISNPTTPRAVYSIVKGNNDGNGNPFDKLNIFEEIITVKIGVSTYALVASHFDDGIQIIDITNPAAPTVTTLIDEGGNGNFLDTFDVHGPITTVEINSTTYALVSGFESSSSSMQIIELTEHVDQTIGITGQVDQAIAPSQHITGTATISQPDLPTITFNDATVDIALNSEGVGSVAFASLVDGTIVSTENLGSNVIQFILDPDDVTLSPRNPNAAGVVDETPFQIPSFQTGAHTVVYNKTHFTFNFNDPTFTGTTPNVILQANIQSDANTLPAIHEDKANIAFNITGVTEICSSSVGAVSLDFGSLKVGGGESSDGTIVVDNDGNVPVNVDIGADPWCRASDNGCISSSTVNAVNTAVMQPSVTRFVGDVPPFTSGEVPLYAAKTPFTNFDFDTTLTPVTRGNSTHLYADNDLFTLEHDEDGTAYLQVSIVLPAESDGSAGRFAGDVTQGIWFDYDCDP